MTPSQKLKAMPDRMKDGVVLDHRDTFETPGESLEIKVNRRNLSKEISEGVEETAKLIEQENLSQEEIDNLFNRKGSYVL